MQNFKNAEQIRLFRLQNWLRLKANYEAVLKKNSINDISVQALLAFDELQTVLYEKIFEQLKKGFQRYF